MSSAYDFLVVGLGNPGEKYTFTRHNAGFLALDYLSQKLSFKISSVKFHALVGSETIMGKKILFMKPQTFMNESGLAVGEACSFYKIPPENVIVIFDDVSFEPGKLRIRRNGSHGGHNGIKSIAAHLSSSNFPRIKLGVGNKPTPEYDLADWVLSKFPKSAQSDFFSCLEKLEDVLGLMVSGDFEKAMGKYN